MTTTLNPYINLRDGAREAGDFYQSVFGGEFVARSTFGEMHASEEPDEQDKIMHSQLVTPSGFTLMISDTPKHMVPEGATGNPPIGFSISLSGDDEDELRGYWNGLSEGATITVPLEKAPWGDSFGMLVDKFGVDWMVNISAPAQ